MFVPIFTATARGKLSGGPLTCRCVLGQGGVVAAGHKREGDGTSPQGTWPLRRVFYRADRLSRPQTQLACIPLRPQDGWCDDPDHPLYNRPVTKPFPARHEDLWRTDHIYDIVVELGHNDAPVQPRRGSAVFLHLARPDFGPTRGCVAIDLPDMLRLLHLSTPTTELTITF